LDYFGWADRVYRDIKGSVYYTEGGLLDLWHGEVKNRIWEHKFKVLSFYPSQDIRISLGVVFG
jgi:hypothetical protein